MSRVSQARHRANKTFFRPRKTDVLTWLLVVVLVVAGLFALRPAYGDEQLWSRSLQLSTSQASAQAIYKLSFTIPDAGTLGSIRVQFCNNTPLINAPCSAGPIGYGFDVSHAVLADQSGETGFSISSATTANVLVLTRTPAPASEQPASYTLANVTNPSPSGSYYARIQTYASDDASGSDTNYGGLAFSIANQVAINAEVPPYLTFCSAVTIGSLNCGSADGDYINLGDLSAASTGNASSQLLVATNAADGYGITADGISMTSGNNIIPAVGREDVSRPGTSQFGLNLRANVAPRVGADPSGPGAGTPAGSYDTPNFYQFVPGDVIASSPVADNYRKYTVSYIVNVAKSQPPGIYTSTLTYVCLANF